MSRSQGKRRLLGRWQAVVITQLVFGLISLTSSARPAQAAPPPPDRPLLLIGGTFMGKTDRSGYSFDADPAKEVKGWDDVVAWLKVKHSYVEYEVDNPDAHESSLFIGEMRRQETQPGGWQDIPYSYLPTLRTRYDVNPKNGNLGWEEFKTMVSDMGGTTAGMARMSESTDDVINQIIIASDGFNRKIDLVAHSQAAAIARRALQVIAAEYGEFPVVNFISLGGGNYGLGVTSPEFNYSLLTSGVNGGFATLFSWIVSRELGAYGLSYCRDNGFLPVCSDIVRYHSYPPTDDLKPDPYRPYNPDWKDLYPSDFYLDLNGYYHQDPLPGASTGETKYVHLYTKRYKDYQAEVKNSVETLELFPTTANVVNRSIQSVCEAPNGPRASFGVHHVKEWTDWGMRALIGEYLGFGPMSGLDCYH
jgi:hypothetical protein